jgi:uncharacterized integral membrane protein
MGQLLAIVFLILIWANEDKKYSSFFNYQIDPPR